MTDGLLSKLSVQLAPDEHRCPAVHVFTGIGELVSMLLPSLADEVRLRGGKCYPQCFRLAFPTAEAMQVVVRCLLEVTVLRTGYDNHARSSDIDGLVVSVFATVNPTRLCHKLLSCRHAHAGSSFCPSARGASNSLQVAGGNLEERPVLGAGDRQLRSGALVNGLAVLIGIAMHLHRSGNKHGVMPVANLL
jgi:hypothetical protein